MEWIVLYWLVIRFYERWLALPKGEQQKHSQIKMHKIYYRFLLRTLHKINNNRNEKKQANKTRICSEMEKS